MSEDAYKAITCWDASDYAGYSFECGTDKTDEAQHADQACSYDRIIMILLVTVIGVLCAPVFGALAGLAYNALAR